MFKPDVEHDGKRAYSNVKGLLKIDPKTGNYKYSSLENFASLSQEENTNTFKVYEGWAVEGNTSENGQFFPFNKASDVFEVDAGGLKRKDGIHAAKSSCLNHYFGMTLSVNFQQPHKGLISNTSQSKNMLFTFTGDDDVWIFIDGVLVADLGGIHDTVTTTIDFATGNITIQRKDGKGRKFVTDLKAQYQAAAAFDAEKFSGKTYADGTVHELKMFYLERGNRASNLELDFNLVEPRYSNIVKVDQDGNGLEGLTFALYEADDQWKPKNDKQPIAGGLTTGKDGMVALANGQLPIAFDTQKRYILREMNTLNGFAATGDIHLTYDKDRPNDAQTNCLKVENKWETGAVAGFEAQIYQTEQPKYADNAGNPDASADAQKGLILAVPMYKPEKTKDSWRALYGSVGKGFHVVKRANDEKSEAAYQKMALEAALRQAQGADYPQWYIGYEPKMMRFEGVLMDLPGSVDRYVFVDKKNGDMLVAYYLFNPDDGTFNPDDSPEVKYSKLAGKMNAMTDEQKKSYFHAQKDNFRRLDIEQFNCQFYSRLYIPNTVRTLRVYKQDVQGNPLPGAEFTLYEDAACTKAVAKGVTDGGGLLSFSAQNAGNNAVDGGQPASRVEFALMRLNGGTEDRSYYLKETKAPQGYMRNETVSEVRITQDSLYVNAGTADDGVSVSKGVGNLVETMVRYAANDELNVTLRDVTATKFAYSANTAGKDLPPFSQWKEASDEKPIDLHFGLDGNRLLDYGVHDAARQPYFMTDSGWMGFGVSQNYEAHQNNDAWSNAGGRKEDIRKIDISALLTGSTTVIVQDHPIPKVGALAVSKTVSGEAGDKSRAWDFVVKLDTPLDGSYGYMTFAKGVASFQLRHGEKKLATGLPEGVRYTVSESEYEGYTTTFTGETGVIADGQTAQAAFDNHKDLPMIPKVGALAVSKMVSGEAGDKSRAWDFVVKLDTPLDGSYGDMTFAKGVAAFQLRHGEKKLATGLPEGVRYTVSESEYEGYTTTFTGETGVIADGQTAQAAFDNHKDLPIGQLPQTGDRSSMALWLALLGICGVAAALLLRRKR